MAERRRRIWSMVHCRRGALQGLCICGRVVSLVIDPPLTLSVVSEVGLPCRSDPCPVLGPSLENSVAPAALHHADVGLCGLAPGSPVMDLAPLPVSPEEFHNERKVTCKHPVTGQPSQDNCIFVVNEQTVATMTSEEKKERPISMINEASNHNMSSDYAVHPMSPVGRDSTGMKLWKKRWFVLSDLCLFYYRDEKEEGILGSILLPSFQIALLTSEDHINRKYAFKAAHPNMRTYYFCTDTGKEMELWMKAMLDAALVQTEPVRRVDKITSESASTKETNNIPNHRVLIKPEAQNNQKNKEISKLEEKKALEAEKYGFQKDGHDRPLTKINSVKLNSVPSEYDGGSTCPAQVAPYRPVTVNSAEHRTVNVSMADLRGGNHPNTGPSHPEADRVIQRTNSMQQLEQWIKIQKGRSRDEETRGVISYQTLPRNMPSHRAQVVARYPEGYRTLPRNSKTRPESICGAAPPSRDQIGAPAAEEKRRSMRDDTMWQLYEWQQRQFYHKQSTLPRHSSLSSPKTMGNLSDQMHSIPASPSHGSIAAYQGYSPQRTYRADVTSPTQRGDVTIDRRHRAPHPKHVRVPDRRSVPAGLTLQSVSPQSLQGKTPEELTLLLIKLRRQQAELSSIREHTLAQLMQIKLEAHSPKLSQDECRGTLYKYRPEDVDIDAKLSRLCEQDKVVHALEEKLQQLHKEKYTLEQALLSASQEIEMHTADPAAIQTVVLQRDDLQNGLLSTCRELSRATAAFIGDFTLANAMLNCDDKIASDTAPALSLAVLYPAVALWSVRDPSRPQHGIPEAGEATELERAWRGCDKLEHDVTVVRAQVQERLERLGEVQEEEVAPPRPPLPRSYDFTEQPPIVPPLPSDSSSLLCYSRGPVHLPEDKKPHQVQGHPRNGSHCGPDYRLYKSEPELTTVAEVDESNGEEKSEPVSEMESPAVKGSHFPIGIVPPRTKSPTPESSTIASYVTLRKTKKMLDLRTAQSLGTDGCCLRERKRALTVPGPGPSAADQGPLQNPSSTRENPARAPQARRDNNVKELDAVGRENDIKPSCDTPAAEIVRLREAEPQNMDYSQEFKRTESVFYETISTPEPNGVYSEEVTEKESINEKIPEDVTYSPEGEMQTPNHKPEGRHEEYVKDSIHEEEERVTSQSSTPEISRENQTPAAVTPSPVTPDLCPLLRELEMTAEALSTDGGGWTPPIELPRKEEELRRVGRAAPAVLTTLSCVAGKSLPPPLEPEPGPAPSLPPAQPSLPPAQPPLPEGSHFMCV
ncbi:Pleckstrin homology domain-containing family A member 5 [Fukomys damarensis]|uniref:Pleckstrin homology domain-containing family A member 5 n=1 Tax=Fukomys damarensis TaxID=885580 RepID=A0A091DWS5_FUKDA|nr:Pleckstrin homology domain-containing family A member 5 [Fukomys damarensis]